jgi:hypothetical protein
MYTIIINVLSINPEYVAYALVGISLGAYLRK